MLNNPFLQKTIENWLTSTNELGYQLPCCQLLLSEGYILIHISKHNVFEQGKDIIAINNKGIPCAFQLKGGNISLSRWREKIFSEIEELINLTIVHPSINKKRKHKSHLVTNGFLDEFPVESIGKYEEKLLEFIEQNHKSVLRELKSSEIFERDLEELIEFLKKNSYEHLFVVSEDPEPAEKADE